MMKHWVKEIKSASYSLILLQQLASFMVACSPYSKTAPWTLELAHPPPLPICKFRCGEPRNLPTSPLEQGETICYCYWHTQKEVYWALKRIGELQERRYLLSTDHIWWILIVGKQWPQEAYTLSWFLCTNQRVWKPSWP